MKTHQLKKLFQFGILLFGILFFTIACQHDDTVDKVEQKSGAEIPTIKTLSLEEMGDTFNRLKNDLGIERYLKLPQSLNVQARTTMDTLGLTIITDIIKQATLGDYTSYTMKILKETDTTVFYNLTIEYKDGQSDMFATKYIPTDYWLLNQKEPFQGTILLRRMNTLEEYSDPDDIFDEDLIGGNDVGVGVGGGSGNYNIDGSPYYPTDCNGIVIVYFVTITRCTCADHLPSECDGCPTWYDTDIPYYYCQDYGYGDPVDTPPDDGGSSGGVSFPDPNDGTSIAVIVKEDDTPIDLVPKTKCQSLNQLVQNYDLGSDILPVVESLRNKLDEDKEWSISYKNIWVEGETKAIPQEEGIQEGISKTRSKLKYSSIWVGQIHTHPNDTYKVFSWLDLQAIKLLYENTNEYFKQDIFIIAVAPNNETYALKVDNIQTLTTNIQNDWDSAKGNTDNEKNDFIERKMTNKYRKSDNLEQAFLVLYSDYGVSLYKAIDTDLSNWKLLELDDEGTVNETTCN